MNARTAMLALSTALLCATAIACSSGGNQPPTSTPAAPAASETPSSNATPNTSPEDALARYVQNRLIQGFVADCDKAKRPDDVGKQCAQKLGKRGDLVAYELGPTFSNPTRIFILKPEAGDWTLVSIETLDPNQPAAPGIPWPLETGAHVVVAGTAPDCLKIRAAPGTGSAQLAPCIKDGTAVTVIAGPVAQDNIDWWQLENLGWAAGDYLRYPDAAPTAEP